MQQKQKSELTRDLIMNKSFVLFYENGFNATSIDKIMQATKLTKGAFYHHFQNKKELGLAVIGMKMQKRVYESMVAPLYESGDPIEMLRSTFVDRLGSFSIYEKKHGCPTNNFINEIGDQELAFQLALKRIVEEWKAAIIYLLERGKSEGTIGSHVNSNAVAVYLISAFEGVRGLRKLYDNDEVLEQYVEGHTLYLDQLKS